MRPYVVGHRKEGGFGRILSCQEEPIQKILQRRKVRNMQATSHRKIDGLAKVGLLALGLGLIGPSSPAEAQSCSDLAVSVVLSERPRQTYPVVSQ